METYLKIKIDDSDQMKLSALQDLFNDLESFQLEKAEDVIKKWGENKHYIYKQLKTYDYFEGIESINLSEGHLSVFIVAGTDGYDFASGLLMLVIDRVDCCEIELNHDEEAGEEILKLTHKDSNLYFDGELYISEFTVEDDLGGQHFVLACEEDDLLEMSVEDFGGVLQKEINDQTDLVVFDHKTDPKTIEQAKSKSIELMEIEHLWRTIECMEQKGYSPEYDD